MVHHPFVVFGPSHLTVLALTILIPCVLAILVRLWPSPSLKNNIRILFVFILVSILACWYYVAWDEGWLTWGNGLPLDLCTWAAVATVAALTSHNQTAFELAYFWALAGTVQGILTPNLPYDFPEIRFVIFSIFHGGIIAAVLFMVLALNRRPFAAAIPKVFGWTVGYALVAGLTDWLMNVNYGFLRSKPEHTSLLDALPSWPYYILILAVLAYLSIIIYYAPFYVLDRVRARKHV